MKDYEMASLNLEGQHFRRHSLVLKVEGVSAYDSKLDEVFTIFSVNLKPKSRQER